MTQDEIVKMAREVGLCRTQSNFNDWVDAGPSTLELVEFAELVADKARQEMREEIIYTWVPPHFVDMAIESCAERAWIALVKHKQPVNVRQDVTEAILSKEKK